MTAAFTCSWPPESIHCNQQHLQHTNLTSRPFVHLHATPCGDDVPSRPLGISLIANVDGAARVIPSSLGRGADTKPFYTTVKVTDITMEGEVSPSLSEIVPDSPTSINDGEGNQELQGLIKSGPAAKAEDNASVSRVSLREPKRKTPASRASSTSNRGHRSTSRSTAGRSVPTSRRSSLQLPSRPGTYSQTSPSSTHRSSKMMMSRQKRDDLLSLHRDSCRLFQGNGIALGGPQQHENDDRNARQSVDIKDLHRPTFFSERPLRTTSTPAYSFARTTPEHVPASSETASPAMSPLLKSRRFPPFSPSPETEHNLDHDFSDTDSVLVHSVGRPSNVHSEAERPYRPVPATVIDWTSPSTRKREYEKIDRSTRGIRGLWRRFAPRWCQSGAKRTPFFEERSDGKANYEGSVRRFRMDIPDEEELDAEANEKSLMPLSGDGNNDLVFGGSMLKNQNSKSSASSCDRGRWHCLKPKRRPTSTW